MTDDAIRLRWARWLGGEALPASEEGELLSALRGNDALREELVADLQFHRYLRASGRSERDADAFARAFLKSLASQEDATRFLKRLESRIDAESAPRAPRRRRAAWSASARFPWLPLILAAGVLLAFVFLFGLASSVRPAGRPRLETARPKSIEKPVERKPVEIPRAQARKEAEERRAEEARTAAPAAQVGELRRKAEEAFAEIRRKREAEERRLAELRRSEEVEKRPAPAAPTRVAVARLERIEGDVTLGTAPAKAGDDFLAGQGLKTGPGGFAAVAFMDGTRLEVKAETELPDLTALGGKRVRVARGEVRAVVSRQPKDQPMVFVTPSGEAQVLGTTLRLAVDQGTRLEVWEGRVRLRNVAGKSVTVDAGQFAVAAAGVELRAESLLPSSLALELLRTKGAVGVNFGPAGAASPDGFLLDSGELFDPKRGFGWVEPIVQVHQQLDVGRPLMTRTPKSAPTVKDPLRDAWLGAGWKDITQTWRMPVPNGKYLVSVCVGDRGWAQGPHHVWIEGLQAVDAVVTRAGDFVERNVRVEVKDLELTVRVGGSGKDFDGTSDTMICFMIVRKAER